MQQSVSQSKTSVQPDFTAVAIAEALGGKRSGKGWMCLCPAHDDRNPSLSISEGRKGIALWKCWAGCSQDKVAAALVERGLWHDKNSKRSSPPLEEICRYSYKSEEGKHLFYIKRMEGIINGAREKAFPAEPAGLSEEIKRTLYNLPSIIEARKKSIPVFVVEGEKDADRLKSEGLTATTNAFGAGKWKERHSQQLSGLHVVILPDNDETGIKHGHDVARSLLPVAKSVRVLKLPELKEKGDVSEWLDSGNKIEELKQLVEKTPIYRLEDAKAKEAPTEDPQQKRIKFLKSKFISGDEWLNTEPEPLDPLVTGMFERGDKLLIIGPPSVRKSFLFLQLLMSMAAGVPFLRWAIPRPVKVAVIQFEMKANHMHLRFLAMAKAMGLEKLPYIRTINARGLDITEEELLPLLAGEDFDFVAIDPFYKLNGTAEDDPEAMTALLKTFDRLAETLNIGCGYIHHDPKMGGERDLRDRGSGRNQIMRDADAKLFITPHAEDEDYSVVLETLLRNYPPTKPFSATFLGGQFADNPDLDPEKKSRMFSSMKRRGELQKKTRGKPLHDYISEVAPWFEDGQVMTLSEFGEYCRDQFSLSQKNTDTLKILCMEKLNLIKAKAGMGGAWLVGKREAVDAEIARRTVQSMGR